MTPSPLSPVDAPTVPRASGFLKPSHERGLRALAAIAEKRFRDAVAHIDAIPDTCWIDRAWKLILRGWVALERGECALAESVLVQAYGLILLNTGDRSGCVEGAGAADVLGEPRPGRLTALALEKLGVAYRRLDDPKSAEQVHRATYELRLEEGSPEELWETATSLGMDAGVAGRFEPAAAWHRIAIEHGLCATEEPSRLAAVSWQHLSQSLTGAEKHDEAVDAAEKAREHWHRHEPGALQAAKADLVLGQALLRGGEALFSRDPSATKGMLVKSIAFLAEAHESLLAFGAEGRADATMCMEQKDFAERLKASLDC